MTFHPRGRIHNRIHLVFLVAQALRAGWWIVMHGPRRRRKEWTKLRNQDQEKWLKRADVWLTELGL